MPIALQFPQTVKLALTVIPTLTLKDAGNLGLLLIDPRGRCNRQGFLTLAIGLLVLQFLAAGIVGLLGHQLDGTLFWLLNGPLFWIGFMAVLKRLHDVGRAGWWAPAAFALWIVGALVATIVVILVAGQETWTEALKAQSALYWLVFAVLVVPAFGGLIWLHTATGDTGANRFGPVPGRFGVGPGLKGMGASASLPAGAMGAA